MNKQLIVYMRLMILYMLKIEEIKKMLKEVVLFFVLQLLEIVLLANKSITTLIYMLLTPLLINFQFSVFGFRFFVLAPESVKLNSLYRASDSLKN